MNTVKIATPGGPDDTGERATPALGLRASCLLVRAVSCARGPTCCKARRRPLDLSSVSRTGKGLKSSQIGLQELSGASGTGRYLGTTRTGYPSAVPAGPYGARHGPWSGIDRARTEGLFTLLVFTCVLERANDRSRGDTGDGEPEPPNNPIFSFVYIVLRIYKSSIEYYTSMTLMYGTGMYTRIRQFILL